MRHIDGGTAAVVCVWLVLAGLFRTASAQEQSTSVGGSLVVRVTDTVGSAVNGAAIAITRESDTLAVVVGSTDSLGVARLLRVPPGGPYSVVVRKIGYKAARTAGLHVRDNEVSEVSIVLERHIAILPEVAAVAKQPRMLARSGFLGVRLLKCMFVGVGDTLLDRDKRELGCRRNRDAHEARRFAKEAAGDVQRMVKRVQKAARAGRRPNPDEALIVLNTARACNRDVPARPPWPRHDPDVNCRELQKRIPRDTLAHLGLMLAALDATESFEQERRRAADDERRRAKEEQRRRREFWQRRLDSLYSRDSTTTS